MVHAQAQDAGIVVVLPIIVEEAQVVHAVQRAQLQIPQEQDAQEVHAVQEQIPHEEHAVQEQIPQEQDAQDAMVVVAMVVAAAPQ